MKKHEIGLSLIELVMTIAIAAIIFSAAVPSFSEALKNSKRTSQLNSLVKDLNLARSEAVKRGRPVTVCKISNTETCDTSADAEGWSEGWLVFVDDAVTPGVWEAGEEVLRVYQDNDTSYRWKANNNLQKFVTYTPRGSSNIDGWFTYCDARSIQQARAILINSVGRPALSADSDNDKIYEDGAGNDLDCS